jgi:hypothetical protein
MPDGKYKLRIKKAVSFLHDISSRSRSNLLHIESKIIRSTPPPSKPTKGKKRSGAKSSLISMSSKSTRLLIVPSPYRWLHLNWKRWYLQFSTQMQALFFSLLDPKHCIAGCRAASFLQGTIRAKHSIIPVGVYHNGHQPWLIPRSASSENDVMWYRIRGKRSDSSLGRSSPWTVPGAETKGVPLQKQYRPGLFCFT